MKRTWISVIAFIFVSMIAAAQDRAAETGYVTALSEVNSSSLLYYLVEEQRYAKAPELSMKAHISVDGMIVTGAFVQELTNPYDQWLEGTYVFPLPETAAVCRFKMTVGDKVIEGIIKEKQEAKKIYEEAKASGKKAALLEQDRPNIFTTSVANIPPKGKIIVELEYQQALEPQEGAYELRFPLVVNPRYDPSLNDLSVTLKEGGIPQAVTPNNPEGHIPIFFHMDPFVGGGNGERNPVDITVDLNAGFPIKAIASLYHKVDAQMSGPDACTLTLAQGPVPADRDFVLKWKPEVDNTPETSAFVEKAGSDSFALLMIQPPSLVQDNIRPIPRETVYIIDHSGSMGGSSIEQAKESLITALKMMGENDTFNIVAYNDRYTSLYPDCRPMTRETLGEAVRYVNGLVADGGTEMMPAISFALNLARDRSRMGQVVFMTDGSVTNEEELFTLIRRRLDDRRLFTIGIGSAPNTYFMRKAAAAGKGTFTYVGAVDEVDSAMKDLFQKIQSPVMQNLEVSLKGVKGELWPQPIPDLYTGEPLIILARLTDASGTLTVKGEYAGLLWTREVTLSRAEEGKGVGTLWARKKIDAILDSSIEGISQDEIRAQVLPIALQFGIVSPYTSFVAVEHVVSRPPADSLQSGSIPPNTPAGWQPPVNQLAATATSGQIFLIIGLMLLAFPAAGFLVLRLRSRRAGTAEGAEK